MDAHWGYNMVEIHSCLDTILEAYIAVILTVEYFYGRSDSDIKKEEKRKASKRKLVFDQLTQGEGK